MCLFSNLCSVIVSKDRNAESLRILEILQLYVDACKNKALYCCCPNYYHSVSRSQQEHSNSTEAATTLALLPFPTASSSSSSTNSSGVKRKHSFSPLEEPRTANEHTPRTPIEKPRDQQSRNLPPQAKAPTGPATFLHPVRASVLPAAEYRFNVSASDYQHIESGVKTLEIRYVAAQLLI